LTFFNDVNDKTNDLVKIIIEKRIVVTYDQQVRCYLFDRKFSEKELSLPKITTYSSLEIENLIKLFNTKKICAGGPNALYYPGTFAHHI